MPLTSLLANDYVAPGIWDFTGTLSLPTQTVENTDVKNNADINYAKVQHVQHGMLNQASGTAAIDETRLVFIARAPCTVLAVDLSIDAAVVGDSTVTVDVKKSTAGGAFTTILTGVYTIDNSNVVRVVANATLSGTPTLIANDILEVVISATVGTGTLPQGLVVDVTIAEEGQ